MNSSVVVVGSANVDIVLRVDRAPAPGETVLAAGSAVYAGGKGLNQVIAAARAGASATLVGALGSDADGDLLAGVVLEEGIRGDLLRRVDAPTGKAFIVVDGEGENSIIVASGANAQVGALTEADRRAVGGASVLLLQWELPLSVVAEAARYARAQGVTVMLNAAPAAELPEDELDDLLADVDHLVVNEHETCLLGGSSDLGEASRSLAARVRSLVVTLGREGCALFADGVEIARVAAHRVTVVDTTGAGDTFCGAFAAAIARGVDVEEAAQFATAAGALSVQSAGAVPSIPTRERIDRSLAERG
ncbi:MAG: hypothetical protein RI885_620 [Actinomycetota bacterium]